ncbi:GntR family transcriptional regulator [Loigolactobacillus bifermentans DSM 20003]|uniref:GntR family transcriptional regulator n=1 Tax=Loigolactobacillus bifermentans DSM 20003 TaxID=1423726 RepID=A0A0R1GG41_9LACO|nr:GntR family transcriptional regulator [Loigolactobacillus bifermentans DSM 20003]QGG60545.1 aminotransferase class I/II-fold pyridoxal phosphate-dependent enzyme [Loigolactobacillus bifermentans]
MTVVALDLTNLYPLTWKPDWSALKRPIYQSLVQQLSQAIASGELLPGTQLPPQRELANFLGINFTTVTRAYRLSQQQGLTYAVIGQGTFVAQTAQQTVTISRHNSQIEAELGFNASFESENQRLQPVMKQVVSRQTATRLLNYDAPTGSLHQKVVAQAYLKQIGITVPTQQLFIASGGLNALTIVLLALFRPGDKIAVDQFTFANFIELARMRGIKLVAVRGDAGGMQPAVLDKLCREQRIKGIYLMPDLSNPTTVTLTLHRRQALAEVIKRHQLRLIEDDYLSFLNRFRQPALPRLSTLLPKQSVYICSLSKPIVSGLRVCYLVSTLADQPALRQAMFNVNVKTSALDVEIITTAFQTGVAERIMQAKYQRATRANQIFETIFPSQTPSHDRQQAFFRRLPIQTTLTGQEVEARCQAAGIHVFHSDRFLVGPNTPQPFLRISLASMPNAQALVKALTHLKQVLVAQDLLL